MFKPFRYSVLTHRFKPVRLVAFMFAPFHITGSAINDQHHFLTSEGNKRILRLRKSTSLW